MGTDKPPIIFVWLGSLPGWSAKSLDFASRSNPGHTVILITDSTFTPRFTTSIEVCRLSTEYVSALDRQQLDLQFSGQFWQRASLRFFVLQKYANALGLASFFHAELDNAIFGLAGLAQDLNLYGRGLFVPRDSLTRAIGSLIYVNRPQSLDELVALYSSSSPPLHDMDALGMYARHFPNYFFSLPTESFQENSDRWSIVPTEVTGGIFDAAAIGQYLLGVDPIHSKFKPSTSGFVNENCNTNFADVLFSLHNSCLFVTFPKAGLMLPVYNLHIHSKDWISFKRLLHSSKFLVEINKGTRMILSRRHMLVFGPPLLFVHRILSGIQSLLR